MNTEEQPVSDMTVAELDRKLVRMRDELRIEIRSYVDERFVTRDAFEIRLTRLALEVVRDVSRTMQAMVRDAMQEVAVETIQAFVKSPEFISSFNAALDARKDQDRKERVEDVRNAIGWVGRLVAFVNPLLSLILALIAIWAVFLR